MTLERVLLAAASAIASALATLGFFKWRRRRKVSPVHTHAVWSLRLTAWPLLIWS